jgi:hypothetical protein
VGESSVARRFLVGIPERRKPLGRPRFRWENNILEMWRGKGAWTGSILFRIGTGGVLL